MKLSQGREPIQGAPFSGTEKSIRVLMLNQAFWPDVAATAQHADDLARFLVKRGCQVTVVSSRTLYGSRGGKLPRHEIHEGIEIFRVGMQLFGKRGIILRLVDFALFYLASAWRCLILPRHDVVICFTTPPFIAFIGVLLKWLKGYRLVYWTMDLYPDVVAAAGLMRRGGLTWRLLQRIDQLCLRTSDRVVVLGSCMKEIILAKGAHADRIETISVWSGTESFRDRPRELNPFRTLWGIGDRFTILYLGNFGLGHDMEAISGAVEMLKDDQNIQWLFIGMGKAKPALEERIRLCGAKNVTVLGFQSRDQLPDLLDVGDAHIVSLLPGWEGLIVPCKFFSVLATAKPVIWVGPHKSECVNILNSNRCGFEVAAGDSNELTRVVQLLARDRVFASEMGERGQKAYILKYSAQQACENWHKLLVNVVQGVCLKQ